MFSKIFPKIHVEGYKFIVISGIITLVFYIFSDFLALIGLLLTVWVYYFFRDPERISIDDDNYLVSPADGEVIKVEEVDGQMELNLENKKFKTKLLNLYQEPIIPKDASLIFIVAPQGKVEAFEVELLRRYMTERNGRIIAFIDPGRVHGLDELFFDCVC